MLADLGYDVVKCRNLTVKVVLKIIHFYFDISQNWENDTFIYTKFLILQEIEEALQKFSKHPHLVHTDSVFVVIMSHGSLQGVCGTDCKPFEIET